MNIERVLESLQIHYSIDIEAMEFLREGGCSTYIVKGKDGNYLLKIIGRAFSETVEQSIDIMRYLEKQAFPVPKIICTNEGTFCHHMNEDGNDYICILYEFIDGVEPDMNDKAREIGELVGKLHKLMQGYPGCLTAREKPFFIDRYINILKIKGCSETVINQYETLGNQVWETIKNLPRGFCHGDLHRGNLLLTPDDKLYLLDFDTSCRAPRMFDIMVMCDTTNYFDFDSKGIEAATTVFNRFAEGYLKFMTLSKTEKEAFYDFIAVRHYQLQATIVEVFGLDCIDQQFIDKQLEWITNWRMQYAK